MTLLLTHRRWLATLNFAVATFMVFTFAQSCSVSFAQTAPQTISTDWARWRGPDGNGIATDQQTVAKWSESENVIWKTKVPGLGHASPIISGQKIFLATSDVAAGTQSVVAFDRQTGKQLWDTLINQGALPKKIHRNNTHASASIAVGDGLVYVLFYNNDQKRITALDLNGKIQWQEIVGDYASPFEFGVGASPIVYGNLVIVPNDNTADGALVAFDGKTGKQVWKAKRMSANYSTPVVAQVDGKDQLLISGINAVKSYDPNTGQENWSAPAKWDITCATMVWTDDIVFASGGYPAQQTLAVAADGSNKVLWEKPLKSYEQSMIVVEGYLYLITNKGVIYCIRPTDGTTMWKQRFKGPVSASPVYSGGMIYFTAENGQTLVIKPNPEKLEQVASNQLGNVSFASFAIADNKIFTRVGDRNIADHQWLYCIGQE